MRAVAVAAAFTLLALAGCISDGPDEATPERILDAPSAAIHDILPVIEEWVPSLIDGKRMHNAVYRPDTDERVPVFINFSPYWGDTAEDMGDNFARYMIEEYVPRGYAVVLSAVRGTGHSEGCFQIGGDQELIDSYDVIEHFANQPWSNGNVAAGGKSYDSTTQNGVIAKYPHPDLKGIFHVSGITDMYRYNYREGVPYVSGYIFNSYYYLQGLDEYGASLIGAGDLTDEDPESIGRVIDDAACTELPPMQANGVGSAAAGAKTPYWIERDWNRYIGDSAWNGSIFFVHGFQDWNVKPDHILPWLSLLPGDVRVKGWLHQDEYNDGHVYPMRDDWNQTMLAWLDHELKGLDTGVYDSPAFDVEGSDGIWRHMDAGPPRGGADGDADRVAWTQDGLAIGPFDQDVRYTGQATVTAMVTPLGPDPVLSVVLYEEDAAGALHWRNEAVLRIVYRNGLDVPAPVTPGQTTEVVASFYPQDDVLPAGSRWVLAVQETPTFAAPLPSQLDTLSVGDVSFSATLLPAADGVMGLQPRAIACFAC